MGDPLRHVKPAVRALKAYTLAARQAPIKINQNENPFELPEAMKRRVVERALARPWGRYPEFDPHALTTALAEFAGWRPDGVLAGNGSNELIEALLLVTVGPGTKVVIPEPTFTLYALLTSILGGEAVRVALGPDLEYDAETIAQARRQREASVTIVCSPNNPTGTLWHSALAFLAERLDGRALLVVDEAYVEFADAPSATALLDRHENVAILRTLSKAHALAGARIGALIAPAALAAFIGRIAAPYPLPSPSIELALAALEPAALEATRVRIGAIRAERERLRASLAGLRGVRAVWPSEANFVLARFDDARAAFDGALAAGVLVRDVSDQLGLAGCLRITVGAAAENAALLGALDEAAVGALA